jgi:hypothetical protein
MIGVVDLDAYRLGEPDLEYDVSLCWLHTPNLIGEEMITACVLFCFG